MKWLCGVDGARARARRGLQLVTLLGLATSGAACGGKQAANDASIGVTTTPPRTVPKTERKRVTARALVDLTGATLGPYMARQGDGHLVAYVSSTENELVAMPLLADGAPAGSAKILGRVPADTSALALRALGTSGFALLLKRPNERGETLEVAAVRPDGTPLSKLTALSSAQGRVIWFDVLRTESGSVAVWAEDSDSADVTLFSQPLDANGLPVGVALRIGKRAVAWAVSSAQGGAAAIAWIARESALAAEGPLLVQRFDAAGKPAGTPVTLVARTRVRGEIEMTSTGGALVLAWSDASESPPQAVIASLHADGRIEAPRPLARRVRSSEVTRLIGGPSGWQAAWRDGSGTAGALQGRLNIGSSSSEPQGILHVSPTQAVYGQLLPNGGAAWLLSARPCQRQETQCELPYEPELHIVEGSERRVVRLEREADRRLWSAWDLSCDAKYCAALAASPGNPTTVYSLSIELAEREQAAKPVEEAALPSVVVAETLGTPVALAQTDGAAVMLTEYTSSTGSKLALEVVPIGAELEAPKQSAAPLTESALLAGGVAAAKGPRDDGTVVAWIGDAARTSQVHVARVDKAGKKRGQLQLTSHKSDKASVCLVRTHEGGKGDAGYFVAWVDERNGHPEIFGARVSDDMTRLVREVRLSASPGDKSELSCALDQGRVALSWTDTRDDPSHTRGDVYAMGVRTRDLSVSEPEHALLQSAPRSFSPVLVRRGDQLWVRWIEESASPGEAFLYEAPWQGGGERRRRIVGTPLAALATEVPMVLVAEHRRLALHRGEGEVLQRSGWLVDPAPIGAAAGVLGQFLLFGEGGTTPGLRALPLR